jgi:hypothetical protein
MALVASSSSQAHKASIPTQEERGMKYSEAAFDFLCECIEDGSLPATLSTEDADNIMAAFDEGASMTFDEMLTRVGLKEPN